MRTAVAAGGPGARDIPHRADRPNQLEYVRTIPNGSHPSTLRPAAPQRDFTHWVVYDLPPAAGRVDEDASASAGAGALPDPAREGTNDRVTARGPPDGRPTVPGSAGEYLGAMIEASSPPTDGQKDGPADAPADARSDDGGPAKR